MVVLYVVHVRLAFTQTGPNMTDVRGDLTGLVPEKNIPRSLQWKIGMAMLGSFPI